MTEELNRMTGSPFGIRGVVEGFYGTYYTFPERTDLIRFLGCNGFNFYMYGPKNDRQHRMRWWDPYPLPILDELGATIRIADECGITFCYAISFGTPLGSVSQHDFGIVTAKLQQFYDRGCRAFAVFLDDISPAPATADADLCNRLHAWTRTLDEPPSLCVCPTEYHGRPPFTAYLHDLGEALEPKIGLMYTGPQVCSREIRREDVDAFAAVVRRQPLLWDNYPVNDGGMRAEMHVGPLLGRDPLLYESCTGILANPMNQPEASKIALLTIADYLSNPERYDPATSWSRALRQVAGEDSYGALRRFAENSLASPLYKEQSPEMKRLVTAALSSLQAGESVTSSRAVADLRGYFTSIDEAGYHLKNRMSNLPLRQNILPWIEALENAIWTGRRALEVLEVVETRGDRAHALREMKDAATRVRSSDHRAGGTAIFQLVKYAQDVSAAARDVSSSGAVS